MLPLQLPEAVQLVGEFVVVHVRVVDKGAAPDVGEAESVTTGTGTAQAIATVPETELLLADVPSGPVAETVYVWVEPKVRPVSENANAEPV